MFQALLTLGKKEHSQAGQSVRWVPFQPVRSFTDSSTKSLASSYQALGPVLGRLCHSGLVLTGSLVFLVDALEVGDHTFLAQMLLGL